ncbi:MAG: tetratricopeptide repeat protein, partial [Anaerolineae bacterium]|nr:tetratricopeptide repeat protein [Anaerolineae bacterium]
MKTRYGLLLILVVVSGCTLLSDPDVPLFPGTAASAVPLLPTETATPLPTPTPTPTPQPDEILKQGDDAYRLGDWETAAVRYRQLLPLSSISQEQSLNATVGLGKTLLASGAFSESIAVLEPFLSTAPVGPQALEARLTLADALMETNAPAAAAEHYQVLIEAAPSLNLYTYQWLADAHFAAGAYDQALLAYQSALDLATTASDQVFLWEKMALTHAALQSPDKALAAYDTILSIARIPGYRARIAYQAAETATLFGDNAEAMRRYMEVVSGWPEESYAYEALVKLIDAGEPVDEFLRGFVDYHAQAYGPAVQAFYRVMEADPEHSGEPHYYAALSYLEAGSPDLALTEFETLLDTHPGDAYWGSALIGKARALTALERIDEAIAAYRQLPEVLPDHPRTAEALWQAAELLQKQGRLEEASLAFVDLAERYPDDSGSPEARFRAGLLAYREQRFDPAAAAWGDLLNWYPSDERAQAALFWLGKMHLQRGDTLSATEALSQVVAFDGWSYYGLRAADLLEGQEPFSGSAGITVGECSDVASQQATLDWMAGWLGLESSQGLETPPTALLQDPRLERGLTLLRLGRFDDGRAELESLREAYAEDAVAQFHLALIFKEARLYRSSILAASAVWRLSPAHTLPEIPRFLGCLLYPTYFETLVDAEAQEFGFDPLVLYALLRQESLFEGFATSYAAAHGLMQVIPSTGQEIATALNWPPDYATGDLYRPMVSVRFGTWYLAQQRDHFEGALYP